MIQEATNYAIEHSWGTKLGNWAAKMAGGKRKCNRSVGSTLQYNMSSGKVPSPTEMSCFGHICAVNIVITAYVEVEVLEPVPKCV